jgi:single-strand DNA-binding protein
MAGSVNKVIIVGNLGKDPEERSFANGGKVVNMTVATSERWKDKASGEQKERTEWHRVAITDDRLCDVAMKFLHKGSKVYLEGQLETRKWQDNDGQDRYSTEVKLAPFRGNITLLDSKGGGEDGERPVSNGGGQREPARAGVGGGGAARQAWSPSSNDLDDAIPFGPEWR